MQKVFEIPDISAFYLPTDSFLATHANKIIPAIHKRKIPTICAVALYFKSGCLTGTVSDYYVMGQLAADILQQHQNGKSLEQIPINFDPNPQMIINEEVRIQLGL